ncbi:hypothetical protein AU476_09200 [Cupriavidus sp. UYMSc13B]|nr:hypothetical protein AU476_09200 [Cupriavidus sp. UYMSc13B]
MEVEKIVSFLKGLNARTSKGVAEWHENPIDPTEFITEVKGINVHLGYRTNENEFGEVDYYMCLVDAKSEELIYEYTDVDLKPFFAGAYSFMRRLYQDARLQAKGFKSKLDAAFDEVIPDDPDHVPF